MTKKEEKEDLKDSEAESEFKEMNNDDKAEDELIQKSFEKKRIKNVLIGIAVFLVILLICGIIKLVKYQDKVYPKSYFYGMSISSMSELELSKVLNEKEKKLLGSSIKFRSKDKEFKMPTSEIISTVNKNDLKRSIIQYKDNKSFLENIKEIIFPKDKNYSFDIEFNEGNLNKKIDDIGKEINTSYKNAKVIIEDEKIYIEKEASGFSVDGDKLKKSIIRNINETNKNNNEVLVNVEFKEVKAKINENDLKSIDTRISKYHTNYSGSEGRRSNVENAAKKIDDLLIMPGEEFSYEKVVGPVTYENGYKDAPVIVNGKSSLGIGGGVCQVSSTMYNAQLKAGILPTERRNHSKPVTYVPRGLDATLASGSIDYKFKNTYEYPLVINTYTKDSNLYIEFWSNKEATKSINYEPVSFISGKRAESYLYGYDSKGNKVYEKFIDTSIYR